VTTSQRDETFAVTRGATSGTAANGAIMAAMRHPASRHPTTKHPAWLRNGNLALAFLLELGALLAFAAAGALVPEGWLQLVAGILGAALFVLVWAIWAAPRSKRRLRGMRLIAFKIAVFGVAALILLLIGQPLWAAVFAVLAAIHLGLAVQFRQT